VHKSGMLHWFEPLAHLGDDVIVGSAHGDGPEERLKVIGYHSTHHQPPCISSRLIPGGIRTGERGVLHWFELLAHLGDDIIVGAAHGDGSEERLEVIGQLAPTTVLLARTVIRPTNTRFHGVKRGDDGSDGFNVRSQGYRISGSLLRPPYSLPAL
jgi:hypothetical protein